MNVSMNYNPAEISVTSVGIGNVRTTSVNYYDESTSLTGKKSGAHYLSFGGKSDDIAPIYCIRLSNDLVAEAKNHEFISQYLVGNNLILRDTGRTMTDTERTAVSHGENQGNLKSATVAVNALIKGSSRSILSYSDCMKIKKWLKGKK